MKTKQIMFDAAKKIDNSGRFQPGHKHSDETRTKFLRLSKVNQDLKDLVDPLNR